LANNILVIVRIYLNDDLYFDIIKVSVAEVNGQQLNVGNFQASNYVIQML